MRFFLKPFLRILTGLAILAAADAKATLQLSWNPSPSSQVAGYYLCWGTNSVSYSFTNTYPASTTNATLSMNDTNVYYLAVAAFDSNNLVSAFSNQIMATNSESTATNGQPIIWPPSPTNSPVTTNISQSPGTNSPSTNITGSTGGAVGPPTNAIMWGVPPILGLAVSNAVPSLSVYGTVGAMLEVECTTNPYSLYSWAPVTNITVTNIADIAATNPPANPDALDLAFVPGAQQFALAGQGGTNLFYRVVMPYDYVVLAGQVLPAKGYPSRLILVTMPGYSDDACYVTAQSSYIHFGCSSNTFELQSSGSTIRQIANQLAASLGQDWTTASEFVYSNGMGSIQATVVETEDPSTDPVAQNGTVNSQIQINF